MKIWVEAAWVAVEACNWCIGRSMGAGVSKGVGGGRMGRWVVAWAEDERWSDG